MADKVVIYDRVIAAHFSPGGIVYRNGSRLGATAQRAAIGYAHKRSGLLKRTITHGIRPNFPRRFHTLVNLKAAAPYAKFVEDGTTGPIVPTSHTFMPIPPYGKYSAWRADSVSGQRAQHFLRRGMNAGLRASGYGSVPVD